MSIQQIKSGSIASVASSALIGQVPDANAPSGSVIQVLQTVKTDVFSAVVSQGSFSDVPGLSVAITPSSATSKILVLCTVGLGAGNSTASSGDPGTVVARLIRGSTSLGLGATGEQFQATFSALNISGLDSYTSRAASMASFVFLDSPNTTSATVYKVAIGGNRSPNNTVYVNRSDGFTATTSSTITVMEIAG